MRKIITSLVILILLIGSLGLALEQEASAQDEKKSTITLGEPDWPGIWAKNAIVEYILEGIGYEVEKVFVSDEIVYNRLSEGEIDVHLGAWMPSGESVRESIEGKYEIVDKNLKEGYYTLGVPKYAWEAGVKSFADLDDHADKFDHKIYAGPVAWPFTEYMEKAIEEDIYGLGDWEVVNTSQTAMVTNMKAAWEKEEWIVSLAWEPHWMNYVMDIKYLKDPKEVWVSPTSHVDTLTRLGFEEDHPQVHQFLQQFEVTNEMSNEWIYRIGQEEEDPEKVARDFVKNNMDIVSDWLTDVLSSDGEPAVETLKNNLEIE